MGIFNLFNKKSQTSNSTVSSGVGSSEENAVLINASNSLVGIQAEYEFVQKEFGSKGTDWNLVQQSQYNNNFKSYDILEIKLSNGSTKKIYFDITNFFGKH